MTTPLVFVTPHAALAFQARVDSRCPDLYCTSVLKDALRHRLFSHALPTSTLCGCLTEDNLPFLVLTELVEAAPHPILLVRTVGPWWFWHEARPAWVAAGIVEKHRGNWRLVLCPPLAERKS